MIKKNEKNNDKKINNKMSNICEFFFHLIGQNLIFFIIIEFTIGCATAASYFLTMPKTDESLLPHFYFLHINIPLALMAILQPIIIKLILDDIELKKKK